jgi:transposase-like protein
VSMTNVQIELRSSRRFNAVGGGRHRTFEPGMTVSLVARRHGVAPNQLFTWRRLVAQGRSDRRGQRRRGRAGIGLALKREIVAASLAPGASVSIVARPHHAVADRRPAKGALFKALPQ